MAATRRIILFLLVAFSLCAQTARYPGAVATTNDLTDLADRAQTTLSSPMNSTATSFTVVSGSKFSAGMILTIDNEQIKICNVAVGVISVGHSSCPNIDGRAWSSTAAAGHNTGALVSDYFVAYEFKAAREEIKAIEAALGVNLANVQAPLTIPLPVNQGGTAAITPTVARTNLGAAASGANGDITSLSALSTALSVPQGGTGANSWTTNCLLYGGGSAVLNCLAAGSQYQVYQAGSAGVPAIGALHLDQAAAVSGALPPSNGGTGQSTTSAALTALLAARVQGQAAQNVQMASGAFTLGNVPKFDVNGNLIDSGLTPATTPVGTVPYQLFRAGVGPTFAGTFSAPPYVYLSDFNFAAIAPGGSLTGGGGSQTITVPLCPLGIATSGSFATPVYLSGGTGTAESLVPSGGTCSNTLALAGSGGTITVSPANSHSGAWTVTSSTGGFQEALNYLSAVSTNGVVWMNPAVTTTLHAVVTFPAGNFTVDGLGGASATIQRGSDYPSGDLFNITEATSSYYYHVQHVSFQNQTTAGQTSGAAVHARLSRVVVENIRCVGGYICLNVDAAPGFTAVNFEFHDGSHTATNVLLTCGSPCSSVLFVPTDDLFLGGQNYANHGNAFKIGASDGVTISNVQGGTVGGGTWMYFNPESAPAYISNVRVDDVLVDGDCTDILIAGGGNIQISNSKFLNGHKSGVTINGGAAPIQIGPGNHFDYGVGQGSGTASDIQQNTAGTFPLMISGNVFTGCDKNSVALVPCILSNGGSMAIFNNLFQSDTAPFFIASESTTASLTISANSFTGVTAATPVSLDFGFGTFPTAMVYSSNVGVDNIIGSVASSAGNLTLPQNPNFVVTNNAGISSIQAGSCWAGRAGSFRTTGGATTFTASASIGNTLTTASNVPVLYSCDGTHIWLK